MDLWQAMCILTAEPVATESPYNGNCSAAPGWYACANDLESCTSDQVHINIFLFLIPQIAIYNEYIESFEETVQAIDTFYEDGNGAFISTCFTHGDETNDATWESVRFACSLYSNTIRLHSTALY